MEDCTQRCWESVCADPSRYWIGHRGGKGKWWTRLGRQVVGNYFGVYSSASMCGNSRSVRGVGEFGGVMLGRSSVDPAPGVSTDPKRRFLGAVALRDRGRKLYPGPGGRAGTSEAEADPKPSGWSMDMC